MRNVWAIYKREMRYTFVSPIAYVVLCMFAVVAGWFFYNLVAYFNLVSLQSMQNPYFGGGQLNLTEAVARPLFHNLSVILLFVIPLMTMRLFAEEKKSGTIELLLTYPVRDMEAVLGKYASAITLLIVMLAITLVYVLLMSVIGHPEAGPLVGGYVGVFLFGAAFVSMGTWVSSLTENQIVAGAVTFGAGLMFFVLPWASSFAGPKLAEFLNQLGIMSHMESFAKGVVDTSDLVYYVLFGFIFLFLTARALESRRWRA